jgi:hypothetical protein
MDKRDMSRAGGRNYIAQGGRESPAFCRRKMRRVANESPQALFF